MNEECNPYQLTLILTLILWGKKNTHPEKQTVATLSTNFLLLINAKV